MTKLIFSNSVGGQYAEVLQMPHDNSLRYLYGDSNDEFCFSLKSEIGELYLPLFEPFFKNTKIKSAEIENDPWVVEHIDN